MAAETVARLRGAPLTYAAVGQTAGELPAGYRHIRRSAVIGSGQEAFAAAAAALLTWQAHLRAGLQVCASTAGAEPGSVVLLGAGAGPIRVHAPCRVVYVTDELARRGFAYGTLPGHPETGEEAFLVSRPDDGTVDLHHHRVLPARHLWSYQLVRGLKAFTKPYLLHAEPYLLRMVFRTRNVCCGRKGKEPPVALGTMVPSIGPTAGGPPQTT